MLKKMSTSLGTILVLNFISCGEKSEEAKELLQRILSVVGIPLEAVSDVCQTSNSSDICEGTRVDKSKSVGDTYIMETATPCKPILLKLQDSDVNYDNGEFFLKFSGVKYWEITKELSILEAMVDASYIASFNLKNIRELNSTEAQDSFYDTLYRDFKININTLREEGLTQTQSIRGTLKEMADELLTYGVEYKLPKTLNLCNGDSYCILNELNRLSSKLLINANESFLIYKREKDNSSPLIVKEVSCEEPKIGEKRLIKQTKYFEDGTKIYEEEFIYGSERLKERNIEGIEEDGSYGRESWRYEYEENKVKSLEGNGNYWELILRGDKIDKFRWHWSNGYDSYIRAVEYDGDRVAKMEETNHEERTLNIREYRYSGDYMVHYEYLNKDRESRNWREYHEYEYNRDHRCITFKELTGEVEYWSIYSGEMCINWVSKEVNNRYLNREYRETQEIIYNNYGVPSRIDRYGKESLHTYTIYQYEE